MYLETDRTTVISFKRASGTTRRLVERVRRRILAIAFGIADHASSAALTILGASALLLGLLGNAFDAAAVNSVLPPTAHHAVWWHWLLHQAAWFAGANIAVGLAVAALAYFIAAQPKAQVIPFHARNPETRD